MNELTSLNSNLCGSLSIDELEARLEMGCWNVSGPCMDVCTCNGEMHHDCDANFE